MIEGVVVEIDKVVSVDNISDQVPVGPVLGGDTLLGLAGRHARRALLGKARRATGAIGKPR